MLNFSLFQTKAYEGSDLYKGMLCSKSKWIKPDKARVFTTEPKIGSKWEVYGTPGLTLNSCNKF